MKRLIIVGNQIDIKNNYDNFINNSDYVIRFNKIDNFNNKTGKKIDELVCRYANAFDIIHGFNNEYNYLNDKIKLDKINFTVIINTFNDIKAYKIVHNIVKKNNISNLKIIYNNLNDSYNGKADTNYTSTGKALIENILRNPLYINYEKYIIGFNQFNINVNGGHFWKLEREQINEYINNNILIKLE